MKYMHMIGIDLGTTSSRVSVLNGNRPIIIENIEGEGTTPSHVAITHDDRVLVGSSAARYALNDQGSCVFAVKRLIGRSFEDPIVKRLKKMMPYNIVKSSKGNAIVRLQEKDYSPEQICAYTLRKLKTAAESFLGYEVLEAVITVPAYFNDSQRQSTRDAAAIAGLDVKRMISEPTAAAIALIAAQDKVFDEVVAVFDLGGGTFDASIIQIEHIEGDNQFEVLSTNGDNFLGGEDFDLRLMDYISSMFYTSHGVDLLEDPVARQRLKKAAEEAKIRLSSELTTTIELPFISTNQQGPKHLDIEISREKFQDLIRDLIERTIKVFKEAVNDSAVCINKIDRVIFVGGSTRIPLVQQYVRAYFGKDIYAGTRREDYVALGAALQGGVLSGNIKNLLLLDVLSHSLGIETHGKQSSWLIEKNTTIPTRVSQTFSTASDNQDAVIINIIQGTDKNSENSFPLGNLELKDIKSTRKGQTEIEITFDIDANGVFHVTAEEVGSKNRLTKIIDAYGELSRDEVTQLAENSSLPVSIENVDQQVGHFDDDIESLDSVSNITPDRRNLVFISYAHEDYSWAQKIKTSLSLITVNNDSEVWIDRMIKTGDYWEERIYEKLEKANVVILILSQDFLGSQFILKNELPRIFAEKERRNLKIFPIMARSCPYDLHHELSKFQFFNNPENPLASLQSWEIEKELTNLAYELSAD